MYFKDRIDAASQLIKRLEPYRRQDCVVLAIPRGGVPIGFQVAREFDFPMDLLMVKKLGHPSSPEYAIGAVSMEGSILEDHLNVPQEYIQAEISRIRQRLKERYEKFRGNKAPLNLKGRVAIIVDDGIATGRTIIASIGMLREQEVAKIVVAVPVSSIGAAQRIKEMVDDFICLDTPEPFFGVGMFYEDFSEVSDAEVIDYLKTLDTI